MERIGEAFAGTELLTIMGKQLQTGDPAPGFCLDYLDLRVTSASPILNNCIANEVICEVLEPEPFAQ